MYETDRNKMKETSSDTDLHQHGTSLPPSLLRTYVLILYNVIYW